MDYSLPGSSVHGILQARILEWAAISSLGHLPNPGIEPGFPALQADSLLCEPPGKHVRCQKKEKVFQADKIASAKALWLEEPCAFRYPDRRPVWLKHHLRGT